MADNIDRIPPRPEGYRRSYQLEEETIRRRVVVVDEPIGTPVSPPRSKGGFVLNVMRLLPAMIRAFGSWFSRS